MRVKLTNRNGLFSRYLKKSPLQLDSTVFHPQTNPLNNQGPTFFFMKLTLAIVFRSETHLFHQHVVSNIYFFVCGIFTVFCWSLGKMMPFWWHIFNGNSVKNSPSRIQSDLFEKMVPPPLKNTMSPLLTHGQIKGSWPPKKNRLFTIKTSTGLCLVMSK